MKHLKPKEKSEAFVDHFRMLQCGSLKCLSNNKEYSIEQTTINIEVCIESKSTLYFIKTSDGILGTAIEYWEY